jgi:CubicO group peptidase (beta-lactamase class C family)
MLVDEGKVNWDDHVIDYLPDFQLYDPYMTREITIRDLLTHRTGLGNTDYLWSWMTISGDSALYKMREVKPTYSLRSSFIYQNLMYLAAGKVIEKVSGISWESFLQKRIYDPLDMKETYAYYSRVKDKPNIAEAHVKYEDEIIKIDQSSADEIGPAGSMWASISDMGKWIQFLLDDGITNGDTLLSNSSFRELFKPQQIIPQGQFYPTAQLTKPNWTTYGLGWFQHDYRGKWCSFTQGASMAWWLLPD